MIVACHVSDSMGVDSHDPRESWPAKFEMLFGKGFLLDQYKDLTLADFLEVPKSTLTPELLSFVDGAVISGIKPYPMVVATTEDLAAAVAAAVKAAVRAAVGPVVAAAIAPVLAMKKTSG